MSDTKPENISNKTTPSEKPGRKSFQPKLLQPDNPCYRDETSHPAIAKAHGKSANLTTSVLSDEQVDTYAPNISKYKTYKNGNGVNEYDHLDEWKSIFRPGIWHQYSDIDSLLKPDKAPASSYKPQESLETSTEAPDSIEDRLQAPSTTSTTKPKPKPKHTYKPTPTTDVPEDKAREDRFTIGDMPEWYQILEKYVRKKREKKGVCAC